MWAQKKVVPTKQKTNGSMRDCWYIWISKKTNECLREKKKWKCNLYSNNNFENSVVCTVYTDIENVNISVWSYFATLTLRDDGNEIKNKFCCMPLYHSLCMCWVPLFCKHLFSAMDIQFLPNVMFYHVFYFIIWKLECLWVLTKGHYVSK